jgi:predicted dehydrogenase
MKVGVIGLGYWGPNLVRNFLAHKDVTEVIGCDTRDDRLTFIKARFPAAKLTKNYEEIFNGDTDIVVIATPVDTHYNLAKKALEAGKTHLG